MAGQKVAVKRRIVNLGQVFFDGLAWMTALVLAGVLRYEFVFEHFQLYRFVILGAVIAALNFVLGSITGLYRGLHKGGSLSEGTALAFQSTIIALVLGIPLIFVGQEFEIPRSTILIATPIFFALSAATRVFQRARWNARATSQIGKKRTLVYGAGDMAEKLVPELLRDPEGEFQVVGLIDDDPAKSKRRIEGVRCLGNGSMLSTLAKRLNATNLIVAIPRADSSVLSRIQNDAREAGLEVAVLPTFSEILGGMSTKHELTELGIEDLVGRRAIEIDSILVRERLGGKKIIVTGAGGSIGIEICRQVSRFGPSELLFLDRDETGLQRAQLVVEKSGMLDSDRILLADIRDKPSLQKLFSSWRPDVVFHAAALKHLPVLERHPEEAWKTNVLGTANLLACASRYGVQTFVNISTDKAADPTSVLGLSKLYAEELTAWYANELGRDYVSVRFGNVLGSRGSLVPTLSELVRQGGPVVLTDPRATRYFMTISEACQLVLQATALAEGGDVLVLDMGKPVKIVEIAEKMIGISGKSVEIVFRGLRPGEKLHERLFAPGVELTGTRHRLIHKAKSTPRDPRNLDLSEFLGLVKAMRRA